MSGGPTLAPGLTATLRYRVPVERTVPHLLPESAEFAAMPGVLATGYLVGLVEWACIRALAGCLAPGQRTVGVHVDLSHSAPTPPGATVEIHVELVAVDDRLLLFDVTARDDAAEICRGRHRRAVIDVERFTARLAPRVAAG